jgi:hypothetical protein
MATLPNVEKWFLFLFFWPHYAGRFFVTDLILSNGAVVVSYWELFTLTIFPALLFTLALAIYLFLRFRKTNISLPYRPLLLILSFLGFVLSFLYLGKAWAGHHFVFIWVPLIVLFCDLLSHLSAGYLIVASLLLASANVIPMAWLSQKDLRYEVSRERAAISAYFTPEKSNNAIINYTSWGYHHIHRAYGPENQMILLANYLSPQTPNKVDALLRRTKRDFYFVCRIPDPNNTAELFAGNLCTGELIEGQMMCALGKHAIVTDVLPGLRVWHIYKIEFDNKTRVNVSEFKCKYSLDILNNLNKKSFERPVGAKEVDGE